MLIELLIACAVVTLLCFILRIGISVVPWFLNEQNLKKKYGSELAVVTGGTSGIGYHIAKKLMSQGISVVIVGLNTDKVSQLMLSEGSSLKQLDLGDKLSLKDLCRYIQETRPSLLVHCAGCCVPSFLCYNENPSHYVETYISSLVELTTSFLKARQQNGGLIFLSSQVSFWCSPFASLYAATKSFTAQFAASIAAEYPDIDVLCLSPGAVNGTAFFNHFPSHWYFNIIRSIGQSAESVSSLVFKALGRVTMVDCGILSILSRIFICFFDENVLGLIAKMATIGLRKVFERRQNLPVL